MLFRKCRRKNIGKNYKKRFQLDLDFLLSLFKKQLRNKKCKKVKKDFVCASLMFKNTLFKKCLYIFLNNFFPYFRFELLSYFIQQWAEHCSFHWLNLDNKKYDGKSGKKRQKSFLKPTFFQAKLFLQPMKIKRQDKKCWTNWNSKTRPKRKEAKVVRCEEQKAPVFGPVLFPEIRGLVAPKK
jgi:hypothetical protein